MKFQFEADSRISHVLTTVILAFSLSGCGLSGWISQHNDSAAPGSTETVTLISAPARLSGVDSASFNFGNPHSVTYMCQLDGGGFSACVTPLNFNGLAVGVHTFQVYSVNAKGQHSETVTFRWSVLAINWTFRGQPEFASNASNNGTIAIDPNGLPWVAYSDSDNGDRLSVQHFDGSSWSAVGAVALSTGSANSISLAIDSLGFPYVAFLDGGNSGAATVLHWNGTSWSGIGAAGFTTSATFSMRMVLDAGDKPYVSYHDSSDQGYVMHWTGSSWATVGPSFTAQTYGPAMPLAIDRRSSSAKPYIAFRDCNNSCKVTVLHWDGTNWSPVGSAGFTSNQVLAVAMALDSSGLPYVAYGDLSLNGRGTVSHWVGSAWSLVGTAGTATKSGATLNSANFAVDSSGTPYVAGSDVRRWDGTAWTQVGGAVSDNSIAYSLAIAVGASNVPHVFFQSNFTQKASVTAYRSDTSASALGWSSVSPLASTSALAAWTPSYDLLSTDQKIQLFQDENCKAKVGGLADIGSATTATSAIAGAASQFRSYRVLTVISSGESVWSRCSSEMGFTSIWAYLGARGISASSGAIAVDSAGLPYIAYADLNNAGKLNVSHWDGAHWNIVGTSGLSSGMIDDLNLKLDSSDRPYVAYTNRSDSSATVLHWSGSAWTTVGTSNFTGAAESYLTLTLDSAGLPYVAYFDTAVGRGSVMHWTGSAWALVGPAGSLTVYNSSDIALALDSANHPFAAFGVAPASGSVIVMKWDGSAWSSLGAGTFSSVYPGFIKLAVNPTNNTPYIGFNDFNIANATSIYAWDGSNWNLATVTGFPTATGVLKSLEFNSTGLLYMAYNDSAVGGKLTVSRWNGTTLTTYGGPGGVSGSGSIFSKLAFGPTGQLYLFTPESGIASGASVLHWAP